MEIQDYINKAVSAAAMSIGAFAIGGPVGVLFGGVILLAGGSDFIKCVRATDQGKFEKHLKSAMKNANVDAALTAFVEGHDDAFVKSTLRILFQTLQESTVAPEKFIEWNFDPKLVADGLVAELKTRHTLFDKNENAAKLAHHLLHAAFVAVSQEQAFWQGKELYVAQAILGRLDEMSAKISRMEEKIGQVTIRGHYANEVGHHYPKYLMQILIAKDLSEDKWEAVITDALSSYIGGRKQLEEQTNLPNKLENLRKKALGLYEQARLEEGEAILAQLLEHADEVFKSAARDRASLLIDKATFAIARLDFVSAMDLHEQAANTVLAIDKLQAAVWLKSGGDIGYKRGDISGDSRLLDRAVTMYAKALELVSLSKEVPFSKYPKIWAEIKINIGNAYYLLADLFDADTLQKSIVANTDAMEVFTCEKYPAEWAAAQSNLGNVYRNLGENGDSEALPKAVAAYTDALKKTDSEGNPIGWATVKMNLGVVYRLVGQRDDIESLNVAIKLFLEALTKFTYNKNPKLWATTKLNLGGAYSMLNDRGQIGFFLKAISAYKSAEKFFTREKAPMYWASIQNSLGNTYRALGLQGWNGNNPATTKAITCYLEALEERTIQNAPRKWAMTMENLGRARWLAGERVQAEMDMRAALKEYRRLDVAWFVKVLESLMQKLGMDTR